MPTIEYVFSRSVGADFCASSDDLDEETGQVVRLGGSEEVEESVDGVRVGVGIQMLDQEEAHRVLRESAEELDKGCRGSVCKHWRF